MSLSLLEGDLSTVSFGRDAGVGFVPAGHEEGPSVGSD